MQGDFRRKFFGFALILSCSLLTATLSFATCHVITPTGSGTNNGADWSNACNGFSGNCAGSAMVHGDTYYIAGGSGGSYNSAAIASPIVNISSTGTNTGLALSIKAATAADHCTDTGWNAATMAVDGGAGQAIFTAVFVAGFEFSTPNVVFDGNFSASDTSSSWGNPLHACSGTQCGIKLDFSQASSTQISHGFLWPLYVLSGANNLTIRATEITGCYTTCGVLPVLTDTLHTDITSPQPSNMVVTHNYWHDSSQGYVATYQTTGTTVTYNYFLRNYSSAVNPAVHGYTWSIQGGSNLTFAYNAVQDMQGTSAIDEVNSSCCNTTTNLRFYGNVVWTSNGNPHAIVGFGNAVVSCTNGDTCSGWVAYNNTVVNMGESISNSLSFGNGTPGSGSSITEANNLFWNASPAKNGVSCGSASNCSTDYDYFSGAAHTPQAHEQTTSVNPLANWMGVNFRPTADTNPGTTLPAPFNVDADGNPRTTWTRGAFQYVGGGSANVVAPPTLLTATVQ